MNALAGWLASPAQAGPARPAPLPGGHEFIVNLSHNVSSLPREARLQASQTGGRQAQPHVQLVCVSFEQELTCELLAIACMRSSAAASLESFANYLVYQFQDSLSSDSRTHALPHWLPLERRDS